MTKRIAVAKIHFLLVIFIFFFGNVSSQEKKTELDSTQAFSLLKQAESFYDNSQLDSAQFYYIQSSEYFHQFGQNVIAVQLLNLSHNLLIQLSKDDSAEIILNQGIALAEKNLPKNDTNLARLYFGTGKLLYSKKFYDEAAVFYRKSLHILRDSIGEAHAFTTILMLELAETYYNLQRYDAGANFALNAIEIRKKLFGTNYPSLAYEHILAGKNLVAQKKYDEALIQLNRGIVSIVKKFGNEHPKLAEAYINIAEVYRSQMAYDAAETHLYQAIEISDQAEITQKAYLGLADLYFEKKDYKSALYFYNQVEKNTQYFAESVYLTIWIKKAQILMAVDQFSVAKELLDKAESLASLNVAKETRIYGKIYELQAELHYQLNDFVKTQSYIQKCLVNYKKNYSVFADEYLRVEKLELQSYLEAKKYDFFLDKYEDFENKLYVNPEKYAIWIAEAYSVQTDYFLTQEKYKQAELNLQKAINIYQLQIGLKHPKIAEIYEKYAILMELQNDFSKALGFYDKALLSNYELADSKQYKFDYFLDKKLAIKLLYNKSFVALRYFQLNSEIDPFTVLSDFQQYFDLIYAFKATYFDLRSEKYWEERKALFLSKFMTFASKTTQENPSQENQDWLLNLMKKIQHYQLLDYIKSKENLAIYDFSVEQQNELSRSFREVWAYTDLIQELLLKTEDAKVKDLKLQTLQKSLKKQRYISKKLYLGLQQDAPKFSKKFISSEVLSIKSIQKKISSEQLTIQFQELENKFYVTVIGATFFKHFSLEADSVLAVLPKYLQSIHAEKSADFVQYSRFLHQKLILPIDKIIEYNKLEINQLRFILDSKLLLLPFESLLTEDISLKKITYKSLPYLVKQYSISYGTEFVNLDYLTNGDNYSSLVISQNQQNSKNKKSKESIEIEKIINFFEKYYGEVQLSSNNDSSSSTDLAFVFDYRDNNFSSINAALVNFLKNIPVASGFMLLRNSVVFSENESAQVSPMAFSYIVTSLQQSIGGKVILKIWEKESEKTGVFLDKMYKEFYKSDELESAFNNFQLNLIKSNLSPKEWSSFRLFSN